MIFVHTAQGTSIINCLYRLVQTIEDIDDLPVAPLEQLAVDSTYRLDASLTQEFEAIVGFGSGVLQWNEVHIATPEDASDAEVPYQSDGGWGSSAENGS